MRAAILKRMAEGSVEKQPGASEQDVLAALQQRLSGAWEKEEEEDEDDDDDFLEAYRRKRLQELKVGRVLASLQRPSRATRSCVSVPVRGTVIGLPACVRRDQGGDGVRVRGCTGQDRPTCQGAYRHSECTLATAAGS